MEVQGRNRDAESGGVHGCQAGNCEAKVLWVKQGVGVERLMVFWRELVFDLLGDMTDCADEGDFFYLKPTIKYQLRSG